MIIALPLLVALVGLLMFVLTTKAELKELGRIAFAMGLLAFLVALHGGWPITVMPH